MKIAYLMDPLESIQPETETTSHLMYECNERGHTVYFLEPHDIYIRGGTGCGPDAQHHRTAGPGPWKSYWQETIRCAKQEHLVFEALSGIGCLVLCAAIRR